MRKRLVYLGLLVFGLAIEIIIARYFREGFIRFYLGDVLVVCVLHCLIGIFIPERMGAVPVLLFLLAFAVELLQGAILKNLPFIAQNEFLSIALGSTFDWWDILCYAIGCIIIFSVEKVCCAEKYSNRPPRKNCSI